MHEHFKTRSLRVISISYHNHSTQSTHVLKRLHHRTSLQFRGSTYEIHYTFVIVCTRLYPAPDPDPDTAPDTGLAPGSAPGRVAARVNRSLPPDIHVEEERLELAQTKIGFRPRAAPGWRFREDLIRPGLCGTQGKCCAVGGGRG